MKLTGKKLTTAILAGLMGATMASGVFAADTAQQITELQQGVNSNRERITNLENAQKATTDYSKDITANKQAISDEATARTKADAALQKGVDANTKAIGEETTARTNADAALQKSVDANTKAIGEETTARTNADAALQKSVDANTKAIGEETTARTSADAALQKSVDANTKAIGAEKTAREAADKTEATARQNGDTQLNDRISSLKDAVYTDLDKEAKAREAETAARIGADKAQDKVIETVNNNMATGFDNINKNIGTITTQLNQQDANEAAARADADTKEATARENGDKSLNDRISSLKDAVYTDLDKESKAREAETAARIGADKAQDKVIEQVNQNMSTGFDNINKNIGTITGQLNQSIANINDTLSKSGAVASADATKAATEAANNANTVANSMKERLDVISGNQNVGDYTSDRVNNTQSIGQNLVHVDKALDQEIKDRTNGDAQLNDRISSLKDAVYTDLDKEATARDKAVAQERADRIGADKAQDKVIEQVNQNAANGIAALKTAYDNETATRQAADEAEKKAREAADKTEATARQNGDTQLNDRISSLKDAVYTDLDKEATARDKAVAQERADRIGADKAQDKVIEQVNENAAKGIAALKTASDNETATRQAADNQLQKQITTYTYAFATNIATNDGNYVKADNTVGQNLNALDAQVGQNSSNINQLFSDYSSMKTDINKVGARSAALAGLHAVDYDPANKLSFSVASGSFKGENSMALGAFYRPNENIMFSAASTMGDSDNAYTFGLSFKIGPSSAKTKSASPDAEELYKVVGQLQDQLAAQQKEIEQLKAEKAAK